MPYALVGLIAFAMGMQMNAIRLFQVPGRLHRRRNRHVHEARYGTVGLIVVPEAAFPGDTLAGSENRSGLYLDTQANAARPRFRRTSQLVAGRLRLNIVALPRHR